MAAGVPAFNLSALPWNYFNYTWHTNLDTYDKIVFDDVRQNVILTAILVYMACEEENMVSREQRIPINPRTGEATTWHAQRSSNRKGGVN